MPWLLDGNNLAGGRDRSPVRRAALAVARLERVRIVVFFDGAPAAGEPDVESLGRVEIRHAAHADGAILAFLRGAGRGWRVATDDRALAGAARAAGAEAVPASEFWRKAARAEREQQGAQREAFAPGEELAYFADPKNRLPPGAGSGADRAPPGTPREGVRLKRRWRPQVLAIPPRHGAAGARKVRTPGGSTLGNAQPRQREGKCHRKHTAPPPAG